MLFTRLGKPSRLMVPSLATCAEDGGKGQYLLCLESSDVSNISADLQVPPRFLDCSVRLFHCQIALLLTQLRPGGSVGGSLFRQRPQSSPFVCRRWASSQRSTQGA